jgi:ABC-type sugar transport system ATPase subunit
LFDEPLSNLDAALRVRMRLEIVRLQRELATTAVYVTHDQVEAMTMASRIAIMKDGAIAQTGAPLDLYHRPRNLFVASFIGSPAMNIFPCRTEDGGVFLLPDGAAKNCLRVGARPEHIRITTKGLAAQIAAVESLGADTMVYAVMKNIRDLPQPVAARAMAGQKFAVGDLVRLQLDGENCRLFDAGGDAMSAPPPRFFADSEEKIPCI